MARDRSFKFAKIFYTLLCFSIVGFLANLLMFQEPMLRELWFEPTVVEIPSNLEENLLDNTVLYNRVQNEGSDISVTPLYWHVPKSGGTTVHDDYGECFSLVEASELGIIGHENDETLQLVDINGGSNHVNVDTTIFPGILRASELGLVPSNIAEIIFSPLLHESATHLFSPKHKGQLFAIFRHPLDRVVSLFYYLRSATWEPTYNPILQNMTLLEYATSELAESNFIVRALVNKMEGAISWDDYYVAKEILRRKCLVGLLDKWDLSMNRFDLFFDFQPHKDERHEAQECRKKLRKSGGSNVHHHPSVDPSSEEYEILKKENFWDLMLYDYIKELFAEQESLTLIERRQY